MIYQPHANVLLINHKYKTIEVFDPFREESPIERISGLIKFIKENMSKFFNVKGYEVESPYEACPNLRGIQDDEDRSHFEHCVDFEELGFCQTYTHIYIHLRLLSSHNNPSETVKALASLDRQSLNSFILKYLSWQDSIINQYTDRPTVFPWWNYKKNTIEYFNDERNRVNNFNDKDLYKFK